MRKLLRLAAALAAAVPAAGSAATYIDYWASYTVTTGQGVIVNDGSTYQGERGEGVFDFAAIATLDGASFALGGAMDPNGGLSSPGQITVAFTQGSVVDGAGADFRLYDTYGLREGLIVEASLDGSIFTQVGTIAGFDRDDCSLENPCANDFDLAGTGLEAASWFRLTVDQNACVVAYPECYDLDTLEALNYEAAAPVPEPAAWAMLIAGFGAVGGAMRRRGRMLQAAA